jgi:5'-nucleotidase
LRILITNDDGINATGLKVLETIARSVSDDVWIVAPEHDQSAVSHSLTLRTPFRISEISQKKYAVSGTPTDCVLAAVRLLMANNMPDLVLSGVNNGANLAEDVTYSGTVAAALEATILGIPAVALSSTIETGHPVKWATAEHWGPIVLDKILKASIPEKVLINVNFPNVIHKSVEGIKITRQGQRKFLGSIDCREDPRGIPYYWIGPGNQHYGNMLESSEPGTDTEAIGKKCISVTPLSLDMTHKETFEQLKELFP